MTQTYSPEDFAGVRKLYDEEMADNVRIHDLVYPEVFGPDEYIGQFSDNSASELLAMGKAMVLPAKARVLDVGCGRGRVVAFLASSFGWEGTGIDLAGVPIADARTAAGGTDASRLLQGNVYDYPFKRPFDGLYGTGSFCHFDAAHLFNRLREMLRVNGVLAFMERIRLGPIASADWDRLTRAWHCPSVNTVDEYRAFLGGAGFGSVTVCDLTPSFRLWQKRSVEVRLKLQQEIITLSSAEYFETSLRLASFENDVTIKGQLGYALFIARRGA
jgi:SAM-dependent methyltransferase